MWVLLGTSLMLTSAMSIILSQHRQIERLESGPNIRVVARHRLLNSVGFPRQGSTASGPVYMREAAVVKVWNTSDASTGQVVPWVRYYLPDGRPRLDGVEIQRTWIDPDAVQGSAVQIVSQVPPAEHETVSLASTGVAFEVLIAEGTQPPQGNRASIPVGGGVSNVLALNQTLWARLRIAGDGMPLANTWWFTFRMRVDDEADTLEIEESPAPQWATD